MIEPVTAIVLAAQRDGQLDPLAAEAGVSHKCLVPIGGRPLLAHVLDALARTEGVARIRISVEAGAQELLGRVALTSGVQGVPVDFVTSEATITDSIYAASRGGDAPYLITTGDNVLLTPEAVRAVCDKLDAGEDAVAALARKEDVLAAHPEAQRNFYRFKDAAISNCNLYGLSKRGLAMAETFRQGGQFFKHPARIAAAFGIVNLILLRFGLVTVDGAMQRLSRRFGVRMTSVFLDDGAYAVDVDNARTYRIASLLMERRAAAASAAA